MAEAYLQVERERISALLEQIDRLDVLGYIWKISKDIVDECYPAEKGGATV